MNKTERRLINLASKLTTEERKALPKEDFAVDGDKYPIDTENRARNALSRVAQFGTAQEQAEVRRKVKEKYPDITITAGYFEQSNDPKFHAEKYRHHIARSKATNPYSTKHTKKHKRDKIIVQHNKDHEDKHKKIAEFHRQEHIRLTGKEPPKRI